MAVRASTLRWLLFAVLLAAAIPAAAQPGGSQALPPVRLEKVFTGLDRPVQVVGDGSGRLYIVEQRGRVLRVEDGKVQKEPYLNLQTKIYAQGEGGLLSLAFHPNFQTNGRMYANFTAYVSTGSGRQLTSFVSEFRVLNPKATKCLPTSERVLLRQQQPYSNHNGGHILFGPDGMLYIGFGDGGSAGDPENRAQNPKTWLGKILRIDVDSAKPYGVPPDNPFVGDKRFVPEIWAMGLRNPWRMCFDAETGAMYAGDVGQDAYEEISVIEKGGNYGWRIREGLHPYRDESPQIPGKLIDPILEYPHEKDKDKGVFVTKSVTGGVVYRGRAIPGLQGWYLYADYVTGEGMALKYDGGRVVGQGTIWPRGNLQASSFDVGPDGEVFVCDHNGTIYRLAPGR